MHVPMHDYQAEYRTLKAEIDGAVQRVLERGRPDWGPEGPAFEEELGRLAGLRHMVGANSGMAALKIALLALGIGPGDEVITVPNSDIASTSAIHHVGAKAVWVDIEADTFNMDPALVEAAITPRTKALLPVHLYGHPADMPALAEIAQRHNLLMVEDACLALGATVNGQPLGTWSQAVAYSHAPSKQLGALGTAGSVGTNDPAVAERLQLFAGYGQRRQRSYLVERWRDPGLDLLVEGVNERLDEVQAAILRAKLPHVPAWIEKRRADAHAYTAAFRGTAVTPPVERPGCRHTYRNYVVRVPQRDEVLRRLAHAGVSSAILYAPPLHVQPVYAHLGYRRGSFPVSEATCDDLLCLPIGPFLSEGERAYVIETLLAITHAL
ncbi:MAG: DegT/DnrJ/EryC1/StrS family aminotransferase [Chloroflexi bacterium]|nr:DegT/DnrJ/EryC1/StrS family aminotransferase [Chloroflexota bacterium]